MSQKRNVDFCIECRKDTEYELKKIPVRQTIREKEYEFYVTTAFCKECGGEMSLPGLIDRNTMEIDEQYRAAENIITIADIEKLMKVYNIGKAPLSLALGFGEVTITRYLAGQVPSNEYSDIMRKALTSVDFMKSLLIQNQDRVGEAAYKKAMAAIAQLDNMFAEVSPKLLAVISCVFRQLNEVTPLMLQKLLYYIQSISMTIWETPIFPENCEAWIHGPVYRNVYVLFKDFKYNPIDDVRFSLLDEFPQNLTEAERNVIALVTNTFGMYSGKTLEKITHKESPWVEARKGCFSDEHSHEELNREAIKAYFCEIHKVYDFTTEKGIGRYIHKMLEMD